MDKDANLIKINNDTKKGMQEVGSFFKNIFAGKPVLKDGKLLKNVEMKKSDESPRNNQDQD